MTAKVSRVLLGQLLLTSGRLSEDQLSRALERQRMRQGKLGGHLIDMRLVSEAELATALAQQHGMPPHRGAAADGDPALASRLSSLMAKRHNAAPVEWEEKRGLLAIAVAEPLRLDVLDEIRFASGAKRVEQRIASERTVERLIAKIYDGVTPPVESEEGDDDSLMAPSFSVTSVGSGPKPREKAGRRKGKVVVADADRKRARAVASLLEFSGYEVIRAATGEEVSRALGEGVGLWAHREFPGAEGFMTALLYDDPGEALADQLTSGARLATEACSLARAAAELKGPETVALGTEAAGLARFMGARRGLGGSALASLEIKAWRAALDDFALPRYAESYPGKELLAAAAVYFAALAKGATRHEAANAVRADEALDADSSTLLLRWALGADLVGRMDRNGRVLLLGGEREALAALSEHLTRAGWELVRAAAWEDGDWDALIAPLALGLNILENWSHGGPAKRPPVFLVSETPSGPDTMYAIRLGAEDVFEPGVQAEVVEAKMQRAARRAGSDRQKALNGDLREMGFADLMQVLSNGSRTCLLKIESPAGAGTVALKGGLVVDARTPKAKGVEAFYEMVGWTEGRFEILADVAPEATTIEGESTEGLLMEGFRLLDESRR